MKLNNYKLFIRKLLNSSAYTLTVIRFFYFTVKNEHSQSNKVVIINLVIFIQFLEAGIKP